MNKALFLPLATLFAVSLSPALHSAEPPPKALTEKELLKTLDGLGKGDPVTKAPLSAEPALPRKETPSVRGATTPNPGAGSSSKSDSSKTKEKKPSNPMPGSTPGQTEITAEEAAFDQKTHQAVFTIKVFVRNPDFTLSCDKLTAFLKTEETKKGAPGAATPRALPTVEAPGVAVTGAAPKAPAGPGGGLDKAIAESNVEIIQDKVSDDGTISHNVAHCKRAEYDSSTGDLVLKGMPEVQSGINTIVATAEETTITMNRDGRLKTVGPHKSTLRENPNVPAPRPATANNNGR